ncbi:E3 ubiquitin-protein ligase MARCHF6-like [Lytechinus variegatus]|uniref:E3 ubiquitin-protein ligase MARCHF6-like n=1 Tax=Lytechinus variegatus TaxID=7654 RepID=UPI001BB12185|nr:E3 ubiquitin-protein ligase MARCHF6-like [Lytechinus variegatus]
MHEKMEDGNEDVCRVCRSEGGHERPLFHPCICTGSIRYIHQDCLVQWLKHSKKEYCELCMHKFTFAPIYSPDMPPRLPLRDIVWGLVRNFGTAVLCWIHYTMVIFAWLGIVPVTASRIYGCLFNTSLAPVLSLPFDIFSLEKMATDILQGCFVVGCTLCALISLVLLREQVAHGGGPEWLEDPGGEHAAGGGGVGAGQGGAVAEGVLERALRGFANNPGQAAQNQQNNGGVRQRQEGAANHQARQNVRIAEAGQRPNEGEQDGVMDGGAGGGGQEAPDQPEQPANNQAEDNAGHDDINWNALEWDRAAEALTWEELLGLDGSLVFLEHVYWVTVLNALFIFLFAFCPYHIGGLSTLVLGWQDIIKKTHFEGLITTMLGYICLAALLVLFHSCSRLLKFFQAGRLFGLCYVVLKVFLLVVLEIGVFPLICGWWLDICSLSLFDVTIQERLQGFNSAPGTATFLHWLVGMAYVFYFASFILLLREVLRPGVLWFLRNLNDPDFNPIQEMIHLPIYRHARRFILSIIVFGSVVLLMVWLPITIIKHLVPSFLPYHMHLSGDTAVTELSLELLLLQVVLPALLEQGHTRMWLKNLIRYWTIMAAYLLDLRSYLLGDVPVAGEAGEDGERADGEEVDNNTEQEHVQAQDIEDVDNGDEDTENDTDHQRRTTQEIDANSEFLDGERNDSLQPVEQLATLMENLNRGKRVLTPDNSGAEASVNESFEALEGPSGSDFEARNSLPYLQLRREHQDSDVEMREEERDAETMATDQENEDDAVEAGDAEEEEEEEVEEEGVDEVVHVMDQEEVVDFGAGLHAAHHAMLNNRQPTHFEPYNRPNIFHFRVILLVVLLCLTLLLSSLVCMTVPVFIGRHVMGLWMGQGAVVHELYTGACGLYICWLVLRLGSVMMTWVPQGVELFLVKVQEYAILGWKSVVVASMLLGVVPLLLGVLFELVVVIPQRVQMDQTPVFFLRQDWALGVLQAKILCALTMMGPSWWLKDVLEQVYQDGLRQLNLTFITRRLALPVTICLLVALTAPYSFAVGIFPFFGFSEEINHQMARRIYPLIVSVVVGVSLVVFQAKQFKKLYEHIKNDKYLVGQQLVNYEPKSVRDNATQTAES